MSDEKSIASTKQSECELVDVLATSLYPGVSVGAIKMVLGYCRAAGLDPMQKPVHPVPMWDAKAGMMRDVVMPGIGLYRTQAARNGCAGISEPDFGPDVTESIGGQQITYPAWCRVTVKRRLSTGEIVDFTAREFWRENYAVKGGKEKSIAPNAMWTKRPYGQLAKCAEAQALRKAFPEIGSEPTADEMAGKSINDDYTVGVDVVNFDAKPQEQKPKELSPYPNADFEENLQKWRSIIESGRKTAMDVIAVVSTRGVLSEQQIRKIKDLAPIDAQPKNKE